MARRQDRRGGDLSRDHARRNGLLREALHQRRGPSARSVLRNARKRTLGHREPAPLASGRDIQGGRMPRQERLRGTESLHRQKAGTTDCQGTRRQEKHTEKAVQGISLTGLPSGTD